MKYTELKTGDRFRFVGEAAELRTTDDGPAIMLTPHWVLRVEDTRPEKDKDSAGTRRLWTPLYGKQAGNVYLFLKDDEVEKL